MEDNTVRVDEIEEYEQPKVEIEESTESSSGEAFAAGIAGGFLAYTVIWGLKKLATFVMMKMAEPKSKDSGKTVVDAEYNDVPAEQEDSEEVPEEE